MASPPQTQQTLCAYSYTKGLLVAPQLWYNKLQGLIDDSFSPSQHDICLFLKKDMLIYLWVDDCGIITPNTKIINDFIAQRKTAGFTLMKDSDYHDTAKGMIEMTQQTGTHQKDFVGHQSPRLQPELDTSSPGMSSQ